MKKHSMLLMLLALVALALPLAASADTEWIADHIGTGVCGPKLTWTLTEDGLLTISGTGEMYDYDSNNRLSFSVKSVVIEEGVTGIGKEAFSCLRMTSVSIPNSVTSIGDEAFFGCNNLTDITIPDSVTSMGTNVFNSCRALTSITIPDSVTGSIRHGAFEWCNNLTSVTIGNGVTSIDTYAFQGCTRLTDVTIGNSVTGIGYQAFDDCTSLESILIPDNVTVLSERAFQSSGLKRVTIPHSITSFNSAFMDCLSLTGVTIENGVNTISENAFAGCTALKSVTIPESVKLILTGAFQDCASLTNVLIPGDVYSIWDQAFQNCTSLTSVTITNKKTQIGEDAFSGCPGLTISCYPGSIAQEYAQANNIKVKLLIPKPTITSQPKSATVDEGKKVTFKVVAEDADSYQWYYRTSASGSWKKCSGSDATTASRSVAAKASYDGYQYRCLVKNSAGSVGSAIATLTVNPKPVITAQPKSTTVNEDQKTTFKVSATGATGYQWYYRTSASGSWKKCAGSDATTATRTVTAKAKYNGYQYRCLVKNSAGSVASSVVTMTVNPKPVITAQPESATVNEGKKTAFKVTATGADSYQWYYRTSSAGKWQKCAGSDATTASRAVTAKAKYNGYQYRCAVKNSAGTVTTAAATLTVNPKPVITVQPKNASVTAGKKATFKVTATDSDTYQWYYRKSATGTWQKCSGTAAAKATYSFTVKAAHNGYQYRCLVKNSVGSVYSSTVTIAVK